MNYTIRCEVCVEDAGKRKELQKWLEAAGYRIIIYTTRPIENGSALFVGARVVVNRQSSVWDHGYDCGDDIGLFMALAAIDTENDRNQWFVFDRDVYDKVDEFESGDVQVARKGEFYLCRDFRMIGTSSHKASPEELVEFFKNRKNLKTTQRDEHEREIHRDQEHLPGETQMLLRIRR